MTKEELLRSAKLLSPGERIDLVIDLWSTIDEDQDGPLTPEEAAEIDRRIADDEANPQPEEDWAELRAKLLRGDI